MKGENNKLEKDIKDKKKELKKELKKDDKN